MTAHETMKPLPIASRRISSRHIRYRLHSILDLILPLIPHKLKLAVITTKIPNHLTHPFQATHTSPKPQRPMPLLIPKPHPHLLISPPQRILIHQPLRPRIQHEPALLQDPRTPRCPRHENTPLHPINLVEIHEHPLHERSSDLSRDSPAPVLLAEPVA